MEYLIPYSTKLWRGKTLANQYLDSRFWQGKHWRVRQFGMLVVVKL